MEEMTGIVRVPVLFVNAYLVETNGGFALVDSGLRGIGATLIRAAVEARFGPGARPGAFVLTHGHFDHAGSARALRCQSSQSASHRRRMAAMCMKPPAPMNGGWSTSLRPLPTRSVSHCAPVA